MTKELFVKTLLEIGFEKKENEANERYYNQKANVSVRFVSDGIVISSVGYDINEYFNEFRILCTLDDIYLYETTDKECYLEVVYSKDCRVRFLPSWHKERDLFNYED